MLETKQIRYFVAVAEERHFSRAADRLCITQSALSIQIGNLERQLGARLLNRNKKTNVTLTVAGQMFLDEAYETLEKVEHAEDVGRRAGRGEVGHIKCGYVASAAFSGVLPKLLRQFRAGFPNVTIDLQEIDTPHQLDGIVRQQLDVGIIRPRPSYPPNITAHCIHSEDLYVALPSSHPLAGNKSISVKKLLDETFIVPQFAEAAGFELQITAMLGEASLEERRIIKTRDFLTAVTLVSAEYGVAITPKSVSRLNIENVAFIPLLKEKSVADLSLIHRKDEDNEVVLNMLKLTDTDAKQTDCE